MSDFLNSKTAIYGSTGSGKSTLGYKLIAKHKPPRVVIIDPEAPDSAGTNKVGEALRQIKAKQKTVVFRGQRKNDKLAVLLFACGNSTKKTPIYAMCDETPGYLDKMTDGLGVAFFRGRHRSFGMMVLAQRPSAIDAGIRTQCANTNWMKMMDHCDLDVAAKQIGPEAARKLSTFDAGQFIQHPPEKDAA